MDKFPERYAALSPEQQALLARRLKAKGLDALLPEPATATSVAGPERGAAVKGVEQTSARANEGIPKKAMQFSLFFFSGDGLTTTDDKYHLLIEGAKFADQHGFSAVWTPERHFQRFGGLYPNPSVLSAALAMVTEHIQIRAGSVVLPLHNPIRVAEEWSVVDNLSKGRIALSAASGWHPGDFVLLPENYERRKEVMYRNLQIIQKLWAGEEVTFLDVGGNDARIRILPQPLQPSLPVWITTSGNPETWAKAGELGFNVLCSLINHPIDELAKRIQLYRDARTARGHAPQTGVVSVMLHTFVGRDTDVVKEQVKGPLRDYLSTFIGQYDHLNPLKDANIEVNRVIEQDREALVSFAFDRYFTMSSLLGSLDKCAQMIECLRETGVDEVACLVDFGLDVPTVMEGLHYLNELRDFDKAEDADEI